MIQSLYMKKNFIMWQPAILTPDPMEQVRKCGFFRTTFSKSRYKFWWYIFNLDGKLNIHKYSVYSPRNSTFFSSSQGLVEQVQKCVFFRSTFSKSRYDFWRYIFNLDEKLNIHKYSVYSPLKFYLFLFILIFIFLS